MKGKAIPAALAALISMAAYLGTLDATFVYDDIVYVKNNPQLQRPGNLFETPFPEYMGPTRGLYRPMTTASLALDCFLFGLEPWGFHLTNVILHGIGTLLFFLVLCRFVPPVGPPFIGALLFGLHPARAEAVAWAVGRSELLAAAGCLLALLLYIRFLERKKSPLLILGSLAAFAFAGLSKENALAFPGILAAYELFLRRKDPWRVRVLRIAPFVVVTVALLGVRYGVLGSLGPQEGQRVLASVEWPTAAGAVTSAVLLGGTFMGMTALGLVAARTVGGSAPVRAIGWMTVSFAVGQMIGPIFGGAMYDLTSTHRLSSLAAVVALVIAALIAGRMAASAPSAERAGACENS